MTIRRNKEGLCFVLFFQTGFKEHYTQSVYTVVWLKKMFPLILQLHCNGKLLQVPNPPRMFTSPKRTSALEYCTFLLTSIAQPQVIKWNRALEAGQEQSGSIYPYSLLISKKMFCKMSGEEFQTGRRQDNLFRIWLLASELPLCSEKACCVEGLWCLLKMTQNIKKTHRDIVASKAVLTSLTTVCYKVILEILLLVHVIVS